MDAALRILLVEDNPGDVFLVKEALSRCGTPYELTVAGDGRSAWELLDAHEREAGQAFNFFLLDLNLPVRTGIELLTRIRRSETAICRAPVVVVTSSKAPSDRRLTAEAGADYYFSKPSNLEEFLELGAIVRQLWYRHVERLRESCDNQPTSKGDL